MLIKDDVERITENVLTELKLELLPYGNNYQILNLKFKDKILSSVMLNMNQRINSDM